MRYFFSNRLLAILGLVCTLPSCKKYLEQKPDASLVLPSTLQDAQALLDNTRTLNEAHTASFGEASADSYFLTDDVFNSFSEQMATVYTWNHRVYNSGNDWGTSYSAVYVANYALEMLQKLPPPTAVNLGSWNNVKGSALFFRAYYFLDLLGDFAKAFDSAQAGTDPGIVLRTSSDFNVLFPRASVGESYRMVLDDALASVNLLPAHPLHVMRPSKAAAYGLLARAYLSMRSYDSARIYADSCLQLQSTLMDYNGDSDIDSTATWNSPFARFNKETVFYTEMNQYFLFFLSYYGFMDSTLVQSYDATDLRANLYFTPSGNYQTYRGTYTGNFYTCFSGIATDEMFLVRAECRARAGDVTGAMSDLNTLLIRRHSNAVPYTPVVANTPTEALDAVLVERRKELLLRGLRWTDIKRLNKEGRNIVLTRVVNGKTFTLDPNSSYYALPLPTDVVQLGHYPQN